jgi:CBS-domain-containing membrane protein
MPTHVVGLARPAHLRLDHASAFEAVVEVVAPLVRAPDDDEEQLACGLVRCNPHGPLRSTVECQACLHFAGWHAEGERLHLRCRFTDRDPISSWMTQAAALVWVAPDERCAKAALKADAAVVHHLLVLDGGHLAGVVCRCDLGRAAVDDVVAAHMTRDVFALPFSATLGEAAAVMRELHLGFLPIISGDLIAGVISRSDLQRAGIPVV